MTPGECAMFSSVGDMFYISCCNCIPVFVPCTVGAVWIGEFVMNVLKLTVVHNDCVDNDIH